MRTMHRGTVLVLVMLVYSFAGGVPGSLGCRTICTGRTQLTKITITKKIDKFAFIGLIFVRKSVTY